MSATVFRVSPKLFLGGNVRGANWEPAPFKGAPGRIRSLKKPQTHGYVPVEGGSGAIAKNFPAFWQNFMNNAGVDHYQHKYEAARGRLRYELNWPWKATMNQKHFDYEMTIDEAEIYYSTPKEGVDFMYDAPPGHESNPLIIRSQTPNMFVQAVVFCKGMCTPAVREGHKFWRMYPGQKYQCHACKAHMELDGYEDVVVYPDSAPLEDETMAPFEHLEPEFEYWMKRGFPLLGHISYSHKRHVTTGC